MPFRRTVHRRTLESAVAAALLAISCAASGDVVTLDFEGLEDVEAIQGFCNGGTGDRGSIGPDYGVSFTSATLAVIDDDAGGSGNIANEPSPSTVMFFTGSATPILNDSGARMLDGLPATRGRPWNAGSAAAPRGVTMGGSTLRRRPTESP